jgi:tetrapyrrole methylase family protein/MazG family protein
MQGRRNCPTALFLSYAGGLFMVDLDKHSYSIDDLVSILARLRSPDGCPWDQKQSLQSLCAYLLEETYETIEAIEQQDPVKHCEELGDLLLQIAFQSQIASEKSQFDLQAVIDGICKKLIRRHPHVFKDASAKTADEVIVHWERIKRTERQSKKETTGILESVPIQMPALLCAQRLSERAARVGFDWENPNLVMEKVKEELQELEQALQLAPEKNREEEIAWELGDLLFAITNLCRHMGQVGEDNLRLANQRFRQRFALVEKQARQQNMDLAQASMEELEDLWEQAKQLLK